MLGLQIEHGRQKFTCLLLFSLAHQEKDSRKNFYKGIVLERQRKLERRGGQQYLESRRLSNKEFGRP